MNNDELISEAIEYIKELQGKNSGGHDAAHSIRVYKNALVILDKEPACDRTVVLLAAILHDADDHKLCNNVNNENTRAFLAKKGISDDDIQEYVNKHSDELTDFEFEKLFIKGKSFLFSFVSIFILS